MSNISTSNNIYIQDDGGGGFQYKVGLSGSFTTLNFPCTITNVALPTNITIFFTTNMTFTTSNGGANCYFICNSSNIIFDGGQNTITLDGITNYPGLIQNGTAGSNGSGDYIVVKNIVMANNLNNSTISSDGGYICQSYFSKGKLSNVVQNCSTSGDVGLGGNTNGGIVGSYVGMNSGSVDIIGCYNTGIISAQYSGGICGRYTGQNGGSVNITGCYSTGVINSYYGGGICGIYTCNANVTYCYSLGSISPVAYNCGGIVGAYACSGIATDVVTISKCFTLGIIGSTTDNKNAGGICGGFSGSSNPGGTLNIINCYSLGTITTGSSGICAMSGANTNITNCYSLGDINNGAYGITYGMDGNFTSTSVMNITNSYSIGNIGSGGSGICYGMQGISPSTGQVLNIISCYTCGTIAGGASGLVLGPSPSGGGSINIINSFASGTGSWSDTDASTYLTGTPTTGTPIVLGSVWNSVALNTPYLLSAFTQEIYNPSVVNTGVDGIFTSLPGVFQSSYTYELVNNTDTNISINGANGAITIDLGILPGVITFAPDVFVYLLDTSRYYNYNFNSFTLNYAPVIPVYDICFAENTPVMVDQGIVLIQNINTKIHTIKNKKIVAITKTLTNDDYLVRFEKNSLGRNYPCADVIMSKDHKILFGGGVGGAGGAGGEPAKMVEADYFVNRFTGVKRVKYNGGFLYNILMEDYERVIVNNMICETLDPTNPVALLYNNNNGKGIDNDIKMSIIRAMKLKGQYLQRKKNAYTKMGVPRFTPFIL